MRPLTRSLSAPFPWFGGKRRVAHLVWDRFGDVRNYIEPFFGSGAVLLGRPHAPGVETVNDRDAFLCNFWRATQADPDRVAHHADWPVSEADLHARHRWLVKSGRPIVDRLVEDADFFDAKIAGWWVWGQCLWIGAGWCLAPGQRHSNGTRRSTDWLVRPDLSSANGRGEIAKKIRADRNGGRAGVLLHGKRPLLTSMGGGIGVHAPSLHGQLPDLGDAGAAGRGIHASGFERSRGRSLHEYMRTLAERLRKVRITCGDWARITGPSVTTCIGATAVFLDPPYDHALRARVYSEDHDVSGDVRTWALANGDAPKLRIALCGYEGEHEMPASWSCVAWKASGGYGARTERGQANARRERIWFSKHCFTPEMQRELPMRTGR